MPAGEPETLGRARRAADEILGKARSQAEQITSDARTVAESLQRDAQERYHQAVGSLAHEREELEGRVDGLRAFERDCRSRLKAYLRKASCATWRPMRRTANRSPILTGPRAARPWAGPVPETRSTERKRNEHAESRRAGRKPRHPGNCAGRVRRRRDLPGHRHLRPAATAQLGCTSAGAGAMAAGPPTRLPTTCRSPQPDEFLQVLGLARKGSAISKSLSAAQQQRLSGALALIGWPRVPMGRK